MDSVRYDSILQLDAFRSDVLAGLGQAQKSLPSRWLYDPRGCELFEAITRLDEYYPTRTETAILHQHVQDIADFSGGSRVLLEYGAGAGVKTEILIDAVDDLRDYVPVDIAEDFLEQTAERFRDRFPSLQTRAVVADFSADFGLPSWIPAGPRLAFFPGSTLGNLDGPEAAAFLRRVRRHVGPDGRAIIGVDLNRDPESLIPAYDDKAGVTAQFNLNLLARINRELDGDFAVERFRHEARWNAAESAIEMHLVSSAEQTVNVADHEFHFGVDETIHTESSRKYSAASFAALAADNTWQVERNWSDARNLFGVFALR